MSINQVVRKKQMVWFCVVLLGFCMLLAIALIVKHASKKNLVVEHTPDLTGVVTTEFNELNNQSMLLTQQSELEKLQDAFNKLLKEQQVKSKEAKESMASLTHQVKSLEEKTKSVNHKVLEKQEVIAPAPFATAHIESLSKATSPQKITDSRSAFGIDNTQQVSITSIESITFSYAENNSVAIPVSQTYMAANCYAKGVVIGGVMANASVNGQGDSRPLLIRILEDAHCPNNMHSPLKGCFVSARVYGDISSERGFARLEQLSCEKKTGILDIPVNGHVYFSDGYEGIRGLPIMRNGKMLAFAGAAGFLSGFGNYVQQSQTTVSTSPLGSTSTIDANKALTFGGAGALKSAADKLADYYIKRADQYHPVIQIAPGSVVEVNFSQGFLLTPRIEENTRLVKKEASNKKDSMSHEITNLIKQAHFGDSVEEGGGA